MSVFNKQIVWIEKTFSEIKVSSEVALDLKYSTQDNFMNKNVYEKFDRCFVSSVTFQKFERACAKLRTEYPMLQFLIWDALRPRSVQAHFYEFLK
ncbi:MAG: hypothetical protein H7326_00840, partial [Bdellovibrionaceae bacterium]|nr:hypothetical protein [Pseudobdellovibrionaceae bacterium]